MLNPNVNKEWLTDSDKELIALYGRLEERFELEMDISDTDFEMVLAVLKERIKMIGVPTLGPNGYL